MDSQTRTREGVRSRLLAQAITTSVLNRGLAAALPLLMVPLGLHYLGADGYGAWATALAITTFVAFADFGVGTGLMTRLGQLHLEDEEDVASARRYVASAYGLVIAIAMTALMVLWASAPFVSWSGLLGSDVEAHGLNAVDAIVLATFSAVIVNIPCSLIVRVQYGVGQQGRSNLWQTVGSVAALLMTWIATRIDPGPGWFVAMAAFAPVVVSVLNALFFYSRNRVGRLITPRFQNAQMDTSRSVVGLGMRFVFVSALMTASIAVDPWIVARTADLGEVPSYSIPFRLFAFVGTIGIMLATPLWPMHARAVSLGDVDWMRKITLRMTLATTVVIVLASLLLLGFGRRLLEVWLGQDDVTFQPILWAGLGLWWVVQSVTGPMFMVQNGAEVLGPQTLGYAAFLVAIPVKWFVSAEYGYEWLPWVGAALFVMLIWPACLVGYRRALHRASLQRAVVREVGAGT